MNNTPTPRVKWWRPLAFELSSLEMFIMRAGFAALAFMNIKWETAPYTEQKFPNGLARLIDFTWLGHHPPGANVQYGVIGFLALYVVGIFPALGLLPTVFFAISIGTLINSQGAINHSWQLVTLMGLTQFAVYAWPRWEAGRLRFKIFFHPDLQRHRQVVFATLSVIAASYVVCGLMKVINSDGLWIVKTPFLAVQLLKTHYSDFYTDLSLPPKWLQDVTTSFLEHPNLARLIFGGGLLIELFGFVLLINRRWAFVGGIAIIALHLSVSRLMNLNFEAHIIAVLIYCVNIPGMFKMWRGEA